MDKHGAAPVPAVAVPPYGVLTLARQHPVLIRFDSGKPSRLVCFPPGTDARLPKRSASLETLSRRADLTPRGHMKLLALALALALAGCGQAPMSISDVIDMHRTKAAPLPEQEHAP